MLSIGDYNIKEIEGKAGLSNRFIRAFRPKLFENGGFPTTVQEEQELVRYIDSMHAYSFENHYNNLCGGITEDEFELLKRTTKDIYDLTKKKYHANFLVKAPMIASICEKRIIEAALGNVDNKRIFEIGGGSGTLGCLLLEDNIKYSATDVTQAFYLIQNRLFDYITNNEINELVTQNLNVDSKCIHIPYWKLWQMRENPINIDLTMSNHALLEMSPNSLRFYLNFCKKAMQESKNGLFVFQGGGWRIDQNLMDLIELFDEYGFYLKYFDHSKEIAGFSLKEGSVKKEVLLALKELLANGVESEKIYALGSNINSRLNSNQIFYCDDIGDRMNTAFQKNSNLHKVDIERVKEYYDSFGMINDSPDDEFAEYISCNKKIRR